MKKVKEYGGVILGSFIIAITLNVFFLKNNIIPNGIYGYNLYYVFNTNASLAKTIFLFGLIVMLFSYLAISKDKIKNALLSFGLISFFSLITTNIDRVIDITSADKLLIAIFGGCLLGIGSKLIYKSNRYVSGSDLIEEISKSIFGPNGIFITYILDLILIGFTIYYFGLENAMYSLIAIVLVESINQRSKIGVSESKVFYIITKEYKKVRKFIIDDLNYDLTVFDVQGGFSKEKNRVLMSAIPTKDYYKLKEGIMKIDPEAFITITDSFELISKKSK